MTKQRTAIEERSFLWQVVDLARNAALLLALYFAYAAVRRVTADEWQTAHLNADWLLDFQRNIGLPSEASLQRGFFLDRPMLVRAANMFYMWAHFPVTAAFLVWAWVRHRGRFSAIRNTLIALTTGGLILHLVFPLAPPRMKPSAGFVDTASTVGPNPYELAASQAANQLAAMPSLHVGWAVLVAISVIALTRSRFRYLVVVHPLLTTSVVILTANHYWTDAIIAVVLVTAAWIYTAKLSDVSVFSDEGGLRKGGGSDKESTARSETVRGLNLELLDLDRIDESARLDGHPATTSNS